MVLQWPDGLITAVNNKWSGLRVDILGYKTNDDDGISLGNQSDQLELRERYARLSLLSPVRRSGDRQYCSHITIDHGIITL